MPFLDGFRYNAAAALSATFGLRSPILSDRGLLFLSVAAVQLYARSRPEAVLDEFWGGIVASCGGFGIEQLCCQLGVMLSASILLGGAVTFHMSKCNALRFAFGLLHGVARIPDGICIIAPHPAAFFCRGSWGLH